MGYRRKYNFYTGRAITACVGIEVGIDEAEWYSQENAVRHFTEISHRNDVFL